MPKKMLLLTITKPKKASNLAKITNEKPALAEVKPIFQGASRKRCRDTWPVATGRANLECFHLESAKSPVDLADRNKLWINITP